MKDYIEIKFWKFVIWLIKRGYGADCPEHADECASCEAKETIMWIEGHIDLIEFSNSPS